MMVCRAVFFIVWSYYPSPPLWIPVAYLDTGRAIAGTTQRGRRVDVGGGIAVCVRSRDVSAWIPAFAEMTRTRSVGVQRYGRKRLNRIFIAMTDSVAVVCFHSNR